MMKTYKVTGAYVTLRVKNELGQEVLLGFYQGATVPDSVNQEDLDRHVRKGMVAEEGSPEADLLGSPAGTPIAGEPPNVPVTEASATTLSQEERVRRAQEATDESRSSRTRRSGSAKSTDEAKG